MSCLLSEGDSRSIDSEASLDLAMATPAPASTDTLGSGQATLKYTGNLEKYDKTP